MKINQISVFLENTPKSLAAITNTLSDNKINIRAISLADSSDFGIVRMIVDKPEEAAEILKKNDQVVTITPVVLVEISDETGSLNKILNLLADNGRNIEYMYGFTGRKTDCAYMIMRCTHTEITEKVLEENGIHLVSQDELADL